MSTPYAGYEEYHSETSLQKAYQSLHNAEPHREPTPSPEDNAPPVSLIRRMTSVFQAKLPPILENNPV
jgi:hypothetical protein